MAKPIGIVSKLDEIDKFLNTTFDVYKEGLDDDKESSFGDESDHGDYGVAFKHSMIDLPKLAPKVLSKLG
jgi:hypothetical protein